MTHRVLMFQGTGSDVGKSLLVMGFCRLAQRRGLKVAPFKPQNMSNNAAVCPPDATLGLSGGEIGRAQALQARAAGLIPRTDFNPVLLKPQTDRRAQIILNGQALGDVDAAEYISSRKRLLKPVCEAFYRLHREFDLVLIEGAGSPAEINLRARDIANMGFAAAVNAPVCLIGDIDRGGVIASVVGTQTVLSPEDAARIRGFIINKFRGDPKLFEDGMAAIETFTGWKGLGLIPWLAAASRLPAEDSIAPLNPTKTKSKSSLKIVAPVLSRMANFDDADPLKLEPNIQFEWIYPGTPLPIDADVIILFGSKSTTGDLQFLKSQGWNHDIMTHARQGKRVLGLCGGYQMLGHWVEDPHGVDGSSGKVSGLGLLDIVTVMNPQKTVKAVKGSCPLSHTAFEGYEIHVGVTKGADMQRPMTHINGAPEGARSPNGQIEGSYVHGVFSSDGYRQAWLKRVGGEAASALQYESEVDAAIDDFADGLESAVHIDQLFELATEPSTAFAD